MIMHLRLKIVSWIAPGFFCLASGIGQAQELIATPTGVPCPDLAPGITFPVVQSESVTPQAQPGKAQPVDVTKTILTLEEWERLNEVAPPAPSDIAEGAKPKTPETQVVPLQPAPAQVAKEPLVVTPPVASKSPEPQKVVAAVATTESACSGNCQLTPGNPLWNAFMDLVKQSAKEEAKAMLAKQSLEAHTKEYQQKLDRMQKSLDDSQSKFAKLEREKREMAERIESLEVALKKKESELDRAHDMRKSDPPKKRPSQKK